MQQHNLFSWHLFHSDCRICKVTFVTKYVPSTSQMFKVYIPKLPRITNLKLSLKTMLILCIIYLIKQPTMLQAIRVDPDQIKQSRFFPSKRTRVRL